MRHGALSRRAKAAFLACLPTCWAAPLGAADTMEVYPVSLLEAEYRLTYEGFGGPTFYAVDAIVGLGLTPRLSSYLRLSTKADGDLANATGAVQVGTLFSALNTRRFDLDLFLEMGLEAAALKPRLTNGFEVNWDRTPAGDTIGTYARLSFTAAPPPGASDGPHDARTLQARAHVLLGGYVTVKRRHRLLLEFNSSAGARSPHRGPVAPGGLAMGYNVKLRSAFELRTQLRLEIPGSGYAWAASLTWGVVARLKLRP